MSEPKRKFESGWDKVIKKQKKAEENAKYPKIDTFFRSAQSSIDTASEGRTSQNQEVSVIVSENPSTSNDTHSAAIADETPITHSTSDNDNTLDSVTNESLILNDSAIVVSNDVGIWSELQPVEIDYLIKEGPLNYQHKDGTFENSKRNYENRARSCYNGLFFGKKTNNEPYLREWLCYSPQSGKVFCFYCKLLKNTLNQFISPGFDDWRNTITIQRHEESLLHKEAVGIFFSRSKNIGIDRVIMNQTIEEGNYWKKVLRRVVSVIKFLSERGIAFRGTNEKFGSTQNGNYLGLLELVAEYDDFLKHHILQYGNKGSGRASYLTKTICEEIIEIMGEKVRQKIIDEIKEAGYFSVSVDSTPDCSHTDQLTVIVRYVSNGSPVERFLTFLKTDGHTGEQLASQLLTYLEDCGIDFEKCRGQSYDNAPNMTGKYRGMQAILISKNPFAVFIPCAGHSLNLVGRAAVDACTESVSFFGIIQQVYKFFVASAKRWSVLQQYLNNDKITLKSLSETRWEAHFKSVNSIFLNYKEICIVLDEYANNLSESGDTRHEASALLNKLEEFEFAIMLILWNEILEPFHRSSQSLQSTTASLNNCVLIYESLNSYIIDLREKFDEIELEAKEMLPDVDYRAIHRRQRTRTRNLMDGDAPETVMDPRTRFRVSTFIPIIDTLTANISSRSKVYKEVMEKFQFLTEVNQSDQDLKQNLENLEQHLPQDISVSSLQEFLHFNAFVRTNIDENSRDFQGLYLFIIENGLQNVFPNVESILRLFLSLMITNCSGERSFSRLKFIKNVHRSTMSQHRLGDLTVLSIECQILRDLSFDAIVSDFVDKKMRQKTFL